VKRAGVSGQQAYYHFLASWRQWRIDARGGEAELRRAYTS
jgi:hypothetical protein